MLQISAELLAMTGDSAVLVRNGKIEFANAAALNLLGENCVGQSLKAAFGEEIGAIQAGSYIGEFSVRGKRYIVRVRSAEGIQAMFLAPADARHALISDAFIYSLRSSLMNVNLCLSLLRSMAEAHPELEKSTAVISHECFRMNRILSNVNLIHTAYEEQYAFAPRELELSCFVKNLIHTANILLSGPEIRFSAPETLSIHADPALIECMIFNLLSNCIIHAKGCSRISISLREGKDQVFLSVDDDGCGIAPEELHTVFDRYRYKREMEDISTGPGFGLTAVRTVAGLHGGTLLLESRQGQGTAVRVSLSRELKHCECIQQTGPVHEDNMQSVLTGLADCLPSDMFSDRYLD